MSWYLFLDDIRYPKDAVVLKRWIEERGNETASYLYTLDWKIARTFGEAVDLVEEFGCPDYISFDHDLGLAEPRDGKDFADWLVDGYLEEKLHFPPLFI